MKLFLKTSTILEEALYKVEGAGVSEYIECHFICIAIQKVLQEHSIYTFLFGTERFENLKLEVQALICNCRIADDFLHKMSGHFPSSKTAKEFRIMLLEMLIKEYKAKGD